MSAVSSGSFTEAVRQELSRLPPGGQGTARRELTGLLRTAGTLTLRGGSDAGPEIRIVTASGAVARRAHALVVHGFGHRPELQVRGAGEVRHSPRYAVVLGRASRSIATELGVLDAQGRPSTAPPGPMSEVHRVALVRGALLGGGSLSRPGREAHLEIAVGDRRVGEWLAALVETIVGAPPGLSESGRTRLVVKSGARIGALLAALGAVGAYLELEEHQLRRQLRADANRLANADRANLGRTIEASATQVAAVERAIRAVGWEGLDEEVREVALARLANPEASLAELGSLLDPPVGKSAIHRRLRRLERFADAEDTAEGEPEDP
ncbi:MAG: DNA-binding protein WhiA [Nitriliruptor sp.]|nr:MAG: DNA-binding protein WhiA [Nitriliruptor sp.]